MTRDPAGVVQLVEAGVPLVPIVVEGTRNALPKHGFWFRQRGIQKVTIRLLSPVSGDDAKALEAEVRKGVKNGGNVAAAAIVGARIAEKAKAAGHRPIGVEGEEGGEWVLLDLQDTLVHVMLPVVREFYNLEKLWSISPLGDATATEG